MTQPRILFIGNSYTFCNRLPEMFAALSTGAGWPVEVSSSTSGGKDLQWHWYSNPETHRLLAER